MSSNSFLLLLDILEWLQIQPHWLVIYLPIILTFPCNPVRVYLRLITTQFSILIVKSLLVKLKFILKGRRLYNQRNKQAFLYVLQETDRSGIYGIPGTQSWFDTFHGKLASLPNKSFPNVRMKKRYNNRKPWLSDALQNSIKLKNKLYYK